jgi:hypothetical protein
MREKIYEINEMNGSNRKLLIKFFINEGSEFKIGGEP